MSGRWAIALTSVLLVAGAAPASTQTKVQRFLSDAEQSLAVGDLARAEAQLDASAQGRFRIGIDWENLSVAEQAPLRSALDDAAIAWNQATGEDLWEIIESNAPIRIRFAPRAAFHAQAAAGRAFWTRNVVAFGDQYVANLRADIVIGQTGPDGLALSPAALRHTIMHELGHVLGLEDGSTGVMGPLTLSRPATAPSDSDLASLLDLRQRARNVRVSVEMYRMFARRT
ncbi:MAG: hypothetical protein KF812_00700 [Fimbriimonadaceae bacterium]|nr:hypothetical protein [Fimbriimonadaceae bacterium]